MASGHVNRANRLNTWCTEPAANIKKALANSDPSTHGTRQPFQQTPHKFCLAPQSRPRGLAPLLLGATSKALFEPAGATGWRRCDE